MKKDIVIRISVPELSINRKNYKKVCKKANIGYFVQVNLTKDEMKNKFQRFMKTGEMLLC